MQRRFLCLFLPFDYFVNHKEPTHKVWARSFDTLSRPWYERVHKATRATPAQAHLVGKTCAVLTRIALETHPRKDIMKVGKRKRCERIGKNDCALREVSHIGNINVLKLCLFVRRTQHIAEALSQRPTLLGC